jgi:hypothetical protein
MFSTVLDSRQISKYLSVYATPSTWIIESLLHKYQRVHGKSTVTGDQCRHPRNFVSFPGAAICGVSQASPRPRDNRVKAGMGGAASKEAAKKKGFARGDI